MGLRKKVWRAKLASAVQNWVCLFSSWAFGKVLSESSLRVSDGKGYVLYILPVKAQTMFENSSGKSHGARGS